VQYRLARRHQDIQQWPALLAARRYHGQQPLRKPTARCAVRAETALAPEHRGAQGALSHIVGGLDPRNAREDLERRLPAAR
jgi:hypothetical protein